MTGLHRAPTRAGRRWTTIAVALTGAAGALATAPAASGDPVVSGLGTTVVTPDNAGAKGFAEPALSGTQTAGEVDFTEEFGDPDGADDGALGLTTEEGSDKAAYFTSAQNGPLAAFVGSASYATYKSSDSTGSAIQYPSYQIAIDANGGTLSDGGFSTLTYEPYYNVDPSGDDLLTDEWQTWDVAAGTFCSTRAIGGFESNQTRCDNGGQRTLDEIVSANPDAAVLGFGLNQGTGNPGIVAAADALEGAGTTYDFELREPAVVIPDPTPDPDPVPDPDPTSPPDPDDHPSEGHDDKDDHGDEDEHGEKDQHGDKDRQHDWSDPGKGDEDGHEHGDCTCP